MKLSEKVLFIGNGINNLENKESWENLIKNLRDRVGKREDAQDIYRQFPLVFENLLLFGIRNESIRDEDELKKIVADSVSSIKPHSILNRINNIAPEHIITSNYDFALENGLNYESSSCINEKRFSIFRRYIDKASNRKFWHIHGDCNNLQTINLGFEHYSGQLQYLRNYVVSGTHYAKKDYQNIPLVKRLEQISDNPDSWVDLIFSKEIHIIGLSLDFIEIDLWWLLAYRAKLKNIKGKPVKNKIYYYIPKQFCNEARGKLELLYNMGIIIKTTDKIDLNFYSAVFDEIGGKPNYQSRNNRSNESQFILWQDEFIN